MFEAGEEVYCASHHQPSELCFYEVGLPDQGRSRAAPCSEESVLTRTLRRSHRYREAALHHIAARTLQAPALLQARRHGRSGCHERPRARGRGRVRRCARQEHPLRGMPVAPRCRIARATGAAHALSCASLAALSNPMLDRYTAQWKAVTETPSDFNTWTALISTAEKLVSAVPAGTAG